MRGRFLALFDNCYLVGRTGDGSVEPALAVFAKGPTLIKEIYIISGDHTTPTKKLAAELGIDHYFAETLPQDKANLIEGLQNEGKFVCYIGDGINDAIALKKSQVSVSLRGASTVATDTAQIILMDESLKQLDELFDISQSFESTMMNSFGLSLIPGVMAAGGILFFHFGLASAIVMYYAGVAIGVSNSMMSSTKYLQKEPKRLT